MICQQAKKAREQAALKNAQILCEELDAEREKKESRRKAAAKKRDKRRKKKQKEQAEKMDAVVSVGDRVGRSKDKGRACV